MARWLVPVVALAASLFPAFAHDAVAQDLGRKLKPRDEVTVTFRDGSVQKGLVESVSGSALVVTTDSKPLALDLTTVQTIRKRGDSIRNGTLIGLVAGLGAGALFGGYVNALCDNEGGTNCPTQRVTSWLVPILAGTGLGAAFDSSRVGTTLVFSSQNQVVFWPIVGRGAIGVQGRLTLRQSRSTFQRRTRS